MRLKVSHFIGKNKYCFEENAFLDGIIGTAASFCHSSCSSQSTLYFIGFVFEMNFFKKRKQSCTEKSVFQMK